MKETCVHKWRFEEPNGTWVSGTCAKCGAEQTVKTAGPPDNFAYTVSGREALSRSKGLEKARIVSAGKKKKPS